MRCTAHCYNCYTASIRDLPTFLTKQANKTRLKLSLARICSTAWRAFALCTFSSGYSNHHQHQHHHHHHHQNHCLIKIGGGHGTFSINRLYRSIGVWNIFCRAGDKKKHTINQRSNTINRNSHKRSSAWALIISLPRKGVLRGDFLANHLASTDNLTRTIKRQKAYKHKLMIRKRWP